MTAPGSAHDNPMLEMPERKDQACAGTLAPMTPEKASMPGQVGLQQTSNCSSGTASPFQRVEPFNIVQVMSWRASDWHDCQPEPAGTSQLAHNEKKLINFLCFALSTVL